MTVELNEENSEFMRKLSKAVEKYYEKEDYDTLVNMVFKEYREYLPFLIRLAEKGTDGFRQVASYASKIE